MKASIQTIKIILKVLLLIFLFTQCGVQKSGVQRQNEKQAERIIKEAKKLTGTKYVYGGKSPKTGFDCSGFVSYVYKKVDVALPAGSAALSKKGSSVSLKKVKKGDLLFFKGSNKKSKKVGHVAIVVENKSGRIKMIHAASRGVVIDTYNDMSYWTARFLFAKRIL